MLYVKPSVQHISAKRTELHGKLRSFLEFSNAYPE